eukprot:PhM_4_TR11207/c0_g2_i1/m.33672/K16675/ZDHHC9_14_18; palmitoyltransferase ZDHHC9/14/18
MSEMQFSHQHSTQADLPPHGTWAKVTCPECSQAILFLRLEFEHVRCAACGAVAEAARAVATAPPSAAIQAMALRDVHVTREIAAMGPNEYFRKQQDRLQEAMLRRARPCILIWNVVESIIFCGRPLASAQQQFGSKLKRYGFRGILTSPNSGDIMMPAALILFLYFSAGHLYPESIGASTAVTAFVCSSLAAMFGVHLIEPGYIPRGAPDAQPPTDPAARTECIAGVMVERTWCETCRILRPYDASHCATCDACVRGFDHHCHVIGACVGVRNIRMFFLFLLFTESALLVAIFKFVRALATAEVDKTHPKGEGVLLHTAHASFVLGVIVLLSISLLAMLMGVARNMMTGATLRQKLKRLLVPTAHLSPVDNCARVWCTHHQTQVI